MKDDKIVTLHKTLAEHIEENLSAMRGPFLSGRRVIIEGRMIPRLTMNDQTDGQISLVLDDRLAVILPKEFAREVAWLIANALAIGEGYPSLNAMTKDRPFAPEVINIGSVPTT